MGILDNLEEYIDFDKPSLDVLCFDCGGMFKVSYGVSNPTKQCPKCQGIKRP